MTEERAEQVVDIIWTVLNFLYILGGMIGAVASKYFLDFFGRKMGLIYNNLFTVAGFILSLISPYVKSAECILIGRFLFGIQAGVAISAVPVYLSEISSPSIRGQTGAINAISISIVVSQIMGLSHLLGTERLWNILLAGSIIPAIISSVFLYFLPETPKALLLTRGLDEARKSLQSLRNQEDVEEELMELYDEIQESQNKYERLVKVKELFRAEFRWPMITSSILHSSLQLCGINSIYFYSTSIYKSAGVPTHLIQYAILSTGLVEFIMLFVMIVLIDRVGRRPLTIVPLSVIIVNFVALTLFLTFIHKHVSLSFLSVASVLVFMTMFAFSLGPIPYLYTAEVFRQNVRSSAVSTCMLINWISNLINTVAFPFLNKYIGQYVFLIYSVLMTISLIILAKKMPETRGKTIEQIMSEFLPKRSTRKVDPNIHQF